MMVLLASDKLNLGSLDGSRVLYPTICGVESEERKKKILLVVEAFLVHL